MFIKLYGSRMNLQKLKESLANTYGSPLLYDGSNGNEQEQKSKCSECKCNKNYNLPFVEAKYAFKSCGGTSQGTNGLELENTVDYTCTKTGAGGLEAAGMPDVCTMELEETVDYVSNTPLEAKSALPPLVDIFSANESTSSSGNLQYMHNLQNIETPMHYKQYFSEKNELQRTLQPSLNQTDEVCGNTVFKLESLGSPVTKHKDLESTLSLFSCDMSSEMQMRKNSLISSGSEKPMSTSVLESSTLPNTSTEVFSASLQWANNVADCCQRVEQCMNYSEVPPLISKERVLVSKGPEATNERLRPDRDVVTCSTPEEDNDGALETPTTKNEHLTVNDIGTKDLGSLAGVAQEAMMPVLHIVEDEKSEAKDVNGGLAGQSNLSSSLSQSCSSESKDVLNMLSGHTAEDTFLIDGPSFHDDFKTYTSTPLPESKNMTFAVPLLEDSGLMEKLKKAENPKDQIKNNGLSGPAGASKPLSKRMAAVTPVNKVKKTEVVTFPKPNFRNVKAKVLSRPALMVKDCPSTFSKSSPRSPQSASNASSPVASPRAISSTLKTVKKKPVLDQDLKAEAVVAKLNKQPINKQLLPSQPAHAPTHTKYALGKVPRAAVLKQTQDEIERASSSNSTRSSGSAAALTSTASSRVTENKDKVKPTSKPAALNGVPMGPDTIEQNGLSDYEKSESQREDCTSADIFSSAEPFSAKLTAPSKNLHNQLLSSLKATTSQLVPKARLHSSEQRRVSLGKNVVTIRVSSPPKGNQQSAGGGLSSPRRKSSTGKPSATITTRSLPRTRIPCKASTLQRTPSVSSICSTHSDHSSVSTRCK